LYVKHTKPNWNGLRFYRSIVKLADDGKM
jgi:hypothetical protein